MDPVSGVFIFILGILAATAVYSIGNGFTFFYILWGLIALIRANAYSSNAIITNSWSIAIVILMCTVISSVKLNYFEKYKERETRKAFIQKLEVPADTADRGKQKETRARGCGGSETAHLAGVAVGSRSFPSPPPPPSSS